MRRRRRWGAVWAAALLGVAALYLLAPGPGPAQGRAADDAWQDDWLRAWAARQEPTAERPTTLAPCPANASCPVPKHLPAARGAPLPRQTVPRIIWQTWADNRPLANQHAAMRSVIELNLEYEYLLFDDEDCQRFICDLADDRVQRAYSIMVPGAAKADIWRLAVIWRYGGVYVDSDVVALRPFREVLWRNASVVSGMGREGDFHQWLLAFAPRHPIIGRALEAVVASALAAAAEKREDELVNLTGPRVYHWQAVEPVLRENGCAVDRGKAEAEGLQLVREGAPCANTDAPNRIGIVQVLDGDMLGGAVQMRGKNIRKERVHALGHVYWAKYNASTMYADDMSACLGRQQW